MRLYSADLYIHNRSCEMTANSQRNFMRKSVNHHSINLKPRQTVIGVCSYYIKFLSLFVLHVMLPTLIRQDGFPNDVLLNLYNSFISFESARSVFLSATVDDAAP